MLNGPQQLGSDQPTEDADDTGVSGIRWKTRPFELAPEQPEADERSHGDHRAEARDFKRTNPKQYGVHVVLFSRAAAGNSVARRGLHCRVPRGPNSDEQTEARRDATGVARRKVLRHDVQGHAPA